MESLRSLTEVLAVGDALAWLGEEVDAPERVYPKEVKKIEDDGGRIRVFADGIHGGSYKYWVDEAGDSEAFFIDPNREEPRSMGAVIFAEITDTRDPVPVRRGYYDSR